MSDAQKIWASFSWDHQPGLKHLNGGVTTVLDLSSNSTAQHFTKSGAGYVEKTQATPSGKTWAVMRQLKHKDTKNVLTLARLTLSSGEQTLATDALRDVTHLADSLGSPGTQCGDTLYVSNMDVLTGEWFNITALDTTTGETVFNLDTLTLLPGTRYAATAGFACI